MLGQYSNLISYGSLGMLHFRPPTVKTRVAPLGSRRKTVPRIVSFSPIHSETLIVRGKGRASGSPMRSARLLVKHKVCVSAIALPSSPICAMAS